MIIIRILFIKLIIRIVDKSVSFIIWVVNELFIGLYGIEDLLL